MNALAPRPISSLVLIATSTAESTLSAAVSLVPMIDFMAPQAVHKCLGAPQKQLQQYNFHLLLSQLRNEDLNLFESRRCSCASCLKSGVGRDVGIVLGDVEVCERELVGELLIFAMFLIRKHLFQ